jgi:hypothetical protein
MTSFFLHINSYTFSDNTKQPDNNGNNYNRLWKISTLSDQLNDTYDKFYR